MRTLEDVESGLLIKLKEAESKRATYNYIWENCSAEVEKCRKEYFSKKPRDPEYKKVFYKAIEEEQKARHKLGMESTKLITIEFKLNEVRRLLNRKRNNQSIIRSV